jgi:hypothetical protein
MRRASLFVPWALVTTFAVGFLIVWLDDDQALLTAFILAGSVALLIAAAAAARRDADPLNPLTLVIIVGMARFLLPWLEIRFGAAYDPTFQAMSIRMADWNAGASFAVLGLLCVAFVWSTGAHRNLSPRAAWPTSGDLTVPSAGFLVGFAGIVMFFLGNAPGSALVSGAFRGVVVQQGTGVYFYLSLILIPSSVMLTEGLARRGHRWPTALAPVVLAGAAYLTLGGRARAATPILAGGILMWYWVRPKINARKVFAGALGVFLLLWLGFFGDLYRGGGGLGALGPAVRLRGFFEYLRGASLIDIGQLHGLAGAHELGPGILHGQTFLSALAWPVSSLLHLPGRSVGVMIVEQTMGLQNPGWGLHPSAIGEAYVNFGVLGITVVCLAFAAVGVRIYRVLLERRIPLFIYSIAVVYLVRVLFESVQKWPEALVVLAAGGLMQWVSKHLLPSTPAPAGACVDGRGGLNAERRGAKAGTRLTHLSTQGNEAGWT